MGNESLFSAVVVVILVVVVDVFVLFERFYREKRDRYLSSAGHSQMAAIAEAGLVQKEPEASSFGSTTCFFWVYH